MLQAIAAGQEVLISYLGETPSKDNTQLMKDYGFVLPGNLNDIITFDTPAGEATLCTLLQERLAGHQAVAAIGHTPYQPSVSN